MVCVVAIAPPASMGIARGPHRPGLCSCLVSEPSVLEELMSYLVSFENCSFSAEVSHSFCCLQSETSGEVTTEPTLIPHPTYPTVGIKFRLTTLGS